jgi:uncharacterized protein (TIGR03435 family)
MNDQLYTLLDVTRLPIGGWTKFLRTTVDLGLIRSNRMSTAQLAGMLSRLLGLPVVDKTGLTAYYDLLVKWTPEEASADAPPGPSIFTAIQDTLGLRLVAGRELVDVLVVEHVERPTAN